MMRKWTRVLLAVLVLAPASRAGEAGKADALVSPVSLVGAWQLLPGREKDDVAADPAKFEGWAAGEVPGRFSDPKAACTWYMKKFDVPAAAKGLDSEIVFERALWHGEVWLNGKKLGGWTDGYAPFRLLATAALKPGGENTLVARAGGRAEAPKAKCGHLLVPAGFGEGGGGPGGILGAVTVRFFKGVRITRAQVLPDLAKKTANVLVRVEAAPNAKVGDVEVKLAVTVPFGKIAPGPATDGKTVMLDALVEASANISLRDGAGEMTVPVVVEDANPWTPANPWLCGLKVTAICGGQPADQLTTRFGMRDVAFKPDGFYLNGVKTRLLGANIMGEMAAWRSNNPLDGGGAKSGLIEPARKINANCIRTHGGPLPPRWLDACDEAGLMVLLEFGSPSTAPRSTSTRPSSPSSRRASKPRPPASCPTSPTTPR